MIQAQMVPLQHHSEKTSNYRIFTSTGLCPTNTGDSICNRSICACINYAVLNICTDVQLLDLG